MNLWLFIPGLILLIILSIDILTTILQMEGGGLISNRFAKMIWRAFYLASGKNGRSGMLRYAGLTIICFLLFSWIILLWLAFSLMFLSDESSVLITSNDRITEPWRKVYFIGYNITSLGNGDVKAGSDFWRITTNFMGIFGTVFITLSISYLVPVLQAVTQKRALAAYIHQLGSSPQEIIKRACRGEDCSGFQSHLNNLLTQILQHSEQHLAYPVLHYFHATDPQYNIALNLAKLDEAVSIEQVCHLDSVEGHAAWKDVHNGIERYLSKLAQASVHKTDNPPPVPYENLLQDIGGLNKNESSTSWEDLKERRKLLLALIKDNGWNWEDVVHPEMKKK